MATTTRTEIRRILSLAAPVVITQVATMMLGVVDTIMVGHVSVEVLAAAALGHIWTFGTLIFAMGVVFGLDPIVTQAHGARDEERVGLALQRGLVVALLASIPVAVSWLLTDPAMRLLGQDPDLARQAQIYAVVQIPSIPFFLAFTAVRQYLQGRGIVTPTMLVAIVANGINVLLNWALIFGHLGMPALGIRGAGIATASTRVFMFGALVILVLALRLYEEGWTPWSRRALERRGLREVLHFGIPVGFHFSLEVWAFQISTLLAGRLGENELAAHTVVLNVASLSFMVPLGISIAAVTRVGNLIGAGKPKDAQHAAWVALVLGATVMTASATVFVLLRHQLPALFTPDATVIALAASILPVAAAFQLFDGTQVVGGGILRGQGSTRPAAVFNLVGYYVISLPLAWWMTFSLGLGLQGIWWGLALGLALVAVMLVAWVWKRGPAKSVSPLVRASSA
jgi:MATE family multidrug resistance protein